MSEETSKKVRRLRPGMPLKLPFKEMQPAGQIVEPIYLAFEVFGRRALHRDSPALAFAYLWRRFGPPVRGCDDEKDLAKYLLRTKDREVVLGVRPGASGLLFGISGYVSPAITDEFERPSREWEDRYQKWVIHFVCKEQGLDPEKDYDDEGEELKAFWPRAREVYWSMDPKYRAEAMKELGPHPNATRTRLEERKVGKGPFDRVVLWRNGSPLVVRVAEALHHAMTDLLRPVRVRDVPMNLLGTDPRTFRGREAPRSKYAGLGIDRKPLDALLQESP